MEGLNLTLQKDEEFWIEARELKALPGFYKWWAKKEDVVFLLNALGRDDTEFQKTVKFQSLEDEGHFEQKNGLYCIYVGISESNLLGRIVSNHINGCTTNSTLRRHLGYVIQNGVQFQNDKKKYKEDKEKLKTHIDDFLKKLTVSCVLHDKAGLKQKESDLINEKLHILNTDKNKYAEKMQKFGKECKQANLIKEKMEELRKQFKDK